jgi:hypothetical protein
MLLFSEIWAAAPAANLEKEIAVAAALRRFSPEDS